MIYYAYMRFQERVRYNVSGVRSGAARQVILESQKHFSNTEYSTKMIVLVVITLNGYNTQSTKVTEQLTKTHKNVQLQNIFRENKVKQLHNQF